MSKPVITIPRQEEPDDEDSDMLTNTEKLVLLEGMQSAIDHARTTKDEGLEEVLKSIKKKLIRLV